MKFFFYYIFTFLFLISTARGEIVVEVNPLMSLKATELRSLNSFSKNVLLMTSGEVEFRIKPFEPMVKRSVKLESVSNNPFVAAFGHTHLLADKEPAALLFGAPPITDELKFDNTTFFSWFFSAGGSDLYDQMWDKLNLNIKGFILQTSGPRALGWFRSPFFSMEDLEGKVMRDPSDFTNLIHRGIGLAILPMKEADIIPELEKGNLDAASWCCPSEDRLIGLQHKLDNYYLQGVSKNILNADLYINKTFYRSLSLQQRKAIELAASSSIVRHNAALVYENSKALKDLIENYSVILHDTPKDYFEAYQKAATKLIKKKIQEHDFFAKVWQSQKDFAIISSPFWSKLQNPNKGLYE